MNASLEGKQFREHAKNTMMYVTHLNLHDGI